MGKDALWPTVWVMGILCLFVSVLLIFGVSVVEIIAVFSLAGNVITVMLYGKMQGVKEDVQRVEHNTNGTMSSLQAMLTDLIEHAKKSVPVDAEKY